MRIGLIAPPFIPVPPRLYGGTELFIAHLAEGLQRRGVDVVIYSNGESATSVENRYFYEQMEWPVASEVHAQLKEANHTAWAVRDAAESCDIIHLNNASGLTYSRFVDAAFVYTVHHAKVAELSELYRYYPDVYYVTISEAQRRLESMPRMRTIHHGVSMDSYSLVENKQNYLAFLGRIAPMKGVHLAIEVAHRSGIPLKIAGEVQPIFEDYFETQIKPHVDGRFIEYVGPADLKLKNQLLGNALAMLFPIQWEEPFGLVMIESMACGTPVVAFQGGSVREVVREGISGCICSSMDQMVEAVQTLNFRPDAVRAYAQAQFSVDAMVDQYVELYDSLMDDSLSLLQPVLQQEPSAA